MNTPRRPDPTQLVPPAESADRSLSSYVADALAAAAGERRSETSRGRLTILGDRANVTIGNWVSNNAPAALAGLRETGLVIWSHRDGFGSGASDDPPLESLDLGPGEWYPPANSAQESLTEYLAGDFAHASGRRLEDLPAASRARVTNEAATGVNAIQEWIAANAPAALEPLQARGLGIPRLAGPRSSDGPVLCTTADAWVREHAARNPEIHAVDAHRLLLDQEPRVRLALAGNERVDPSALKRLQADPDPFVRAALAKNPSIAPETLHALSQDGNPRVRAYAAKNPAASPPMRERLAGEDLAVPVMVDIDAQVRRRLSSHQRSHPPSAAGPTAAPTPHR